MSNEIKITNATDSELLAEMQRRGWEYKTRRVAYGMSRRPFRLERLQRERPEVPPIGEQR